MRICRFQHAGRTGVGFYDELSVVPLEEAAGAYEQATSQSLGIPQTSNVLELLPHGESHESAKQLRAWMDGAGREAVQTIAISHDDLQLLVPVPRPNKIFLLAGNYAKHIEEGGGVATERSETFPYVFMKPPSTTLNDPGRPVRIPRVSPDAIDWELELAVIIGRLAKGIKQADALNYVAGYTVINDISNRKFRPNPNRKERDKDRFFDWLHGKWHDSSCPCGPCVAAPETVGDPQQLELKLRVNGQVKQDSSTANQIFPVAAVIEFISSFVTLEPGDIISTGTPEGVGNTTGTYLKPGDLIEASIGSIGTLVSPVVAGED